MEAGASFHQDPGHMTGGPREGAVRAAGDAGAGWVAFAAAYLGIAGGMHVIWGIVALSNKSAFHEEGLVWSKLDTWGWIAIVLGALQIVAAIMIYAQRFAGQWLGGVLAVAGVFLCFIAAGAYPIWSVMALVANGLVLWAVTAHGDEFDD
ncbi:MAG TPA: hypothetical protein VF080_13455 [Solirubrobacteraceae bacterium]